MTLSFLKSEIMQRQELDTAATDLELQCALPTLRFLG